MRKTSIYLNKERSDAIEASGVSLLDLIDAGLAKFAAERTALYLLHGGDELLYVGVSRDPERRFGQHAAEKPWWPQVTSRTVEWFGSRFDAEAAERAAIAALEPLHNISPGRPGRTGSKVSVYLNRRVLAQMENDPRALTQIIEDGLAAGSSDKGYQDDFPQPPGAGRKTSVYLPPGSAAALDADARTVAQVIEDGLRVRALAAS